MLNYITAPHVYVWSAALAACSFPYIYEPVELKCSDINQKETKYEFNDVKYIDGSYDTNWPMEIVTQLFNTNSFIVS